MKMSSLSMSLVLAAVSASTLAFASSTKTQAPAVGDHTVSVSYRCVYQLLQSDASGPYVIKPESMLLEETFNLHRTPNMIWGDGAIAKQVATSDGSLRYTLERVLNPNDPMSVGVVFSQTDENNQALPIGTWSASFGYAYNTPNRLVHGESFMMTAPIELPTNPPPNVVRAMAVLSCTTK